VQAYCQNAAGYFVQNQKNRRTVWAKYFTSLLNYFQGDLRGARQRVAVAGHSGLSFAGDLGTGFSVFGLELRGSVQDGTIQPSRDRE
jgi:hypothetical protein